MCIDVLKLKTKLRKLSVVDSVSTSTKNISPTFFSFLKNCQNYLQFSRQKTCVGKPYFCFEFYFLCERILLIKINR